MCDTFKWSIVEKKREAAKKREARESQNRLLVLFRIEK